jgi:hypothetical protein
MTTGRATAARTAEADVRRIAVRNMFAARDLLEGRKKKKRGEERKEEVN